MTVNVLSGLKTKRDELSKQLLNHRTEMHKTIAALDSLDSTIRLYDPNFKSESDYNRAQGKGNRWFRKGELFCIEPLDGSFGFTAHTAYL